VNESQLATPCVLCREAADEFIRLERLYADDEPQRWAPICRECLKVAGTHSSLVGWCAQGAHAGRRGERCRQHDVLYSD
jgi:hypothetical protein